MQRFQRTGHKMKFIEVTDIILIFFFIDDAIPIKKEAPGVVNSDFFHEIFVENKEGISFWARA